MAGQNQTHVVLFQFEPNILTGTVEPGIDWKCQRESEMGCTILINYGYFSLKEESFRAYEYVPKVCRYLEITAQYELKWSILQMYLQIEFIIHKLPRVQTCLFSMEYTTLVFYSQIPLCRQEFHENKMGASVSERQKIAVSKLNDDSISSQQYWVWKKEPNNFFLQRSTKIC